MANQDIFMLVSGKKKKVGEINFVEEDGVLVHESVSFDLFRKVSSKEYAEELIEELTSAYSEYYGLTLIDDEDGED